MHIRALATLAGVATLLTAAGTAVAEAAPSGACPPNWSLTAVDPDNEAAVGADRNQDGLICVSEPRQTPNFTFRAVTDNRSTAWN